MSESEKMRSELKSIIEAVILAAGEPVHLERLRDLFDEAQKPSTQDLRNALAEIQADCEQRGIELKEVASGFCFQAKQDFAPWIKRLWPEKAPRYSRAFLETLAVIAYRQPITRGEIEDIRGVAVSSNIVKTLLEREWIKIVGHREVPGRPSVYATTKQFLDYFNLKNLEELPALIESQDIDELAKQLEMQVAVNETVSDEAQSSVQKTEELNDTISASLEPIEAVDVMMVKEPLAKTTNESFNAEEVLA